MNDRNVGIGKCCVNTHSLAAPDELFKELRMQRKRGLPVFITHKDVQVFAAGWCSHENPAADPE